MKNKHILIVITIGVIFLIGFSNYKRNTKELVENRLAQTVDLGIPDVPSLDEVEVEEIIEYEEEEFTIPDIPIDVEKEEDYKER